eukprot:6419721-Lingulodinium_polyedra.AAC.1
MFASSRGLRAECVMPRHRAACQVAGVRLRASVARAYVSQALAILGAWSARVRKREVRCDARASARCI